LVRSGLRHRPLDLPLDHQGNDPTEDRPILLGGCWLIRGSPEVQDVKGGRAPVNSDSAEVRSPNRTAWILDDKNATKPEPWHRERVLP